MKGKYILIPIVVSQQQTFTYIIDTQVNISFYLFIYRYYLKFRYFERMINYLETSFNIDDNIVNFS